MKPICPYRNRLKNVLVKRARLLILFILYFNFSYAQPTNISGIVNTYHRVIEILPAKSCIRVANPAGLNLNNLVMLIQMKGATINTDGTSSSFGDTTNLWGAGNYEIGTICYIIGDSVFLFHNLLNSYDVNAKVQLVQFAEYYSANVVDTVKALKWNNTTGLGGVIAIFADQDITLNAPVYADSSGYSGGNYSPSSNFCLNSPLHASAYAYDATNTNPQYGAYKGEGVAILAALQTGGRGAPANGGGGGNNHNNSGGGGANLNAGGLGGGNSSTAGCITPIRGLGGKELSSWNGKKIFLGGGGGAGHSNNGSPLLCYGGNGGGIVFIWSNNLIGNGNTISARGGKGGNSSGDGAGGGGAGGTIILHSTNYTGSVTIDAKGGDGGLSANGNTLNRCYGGGGGGSGGVVYFTGTNPGLPVSVDGGAFGPETGRDGGCNPVPQQALPGSNGQTNINYNFSRSTNPAGYCQLLLPSKLLFFKAQKVNRSVVLNWQVDYPALVKNFIVEKRVGNGSWISLPAITADDNRFKYASVDNSPSKGDNFYRLKISEKDGSVYYSEIRKLWFGSPDGDFTIFPNPSAGKVTLSGNFETNSLLQVTDISGKVVWQQYIRGNQVRIDLPRFAAGLYLVRYQDAVKKLLVK